MNRGYIKSVKSFGDAYRKQNGPATSSKINEAKAGPINVVVVGEKDSIAFKNWIAAQDNKLLSVGVKVDGKQLTDAEVLALVADQKAYTAPYLAVVTTTEPDESFKALKKILTEGSSAVDLEFTVAEALYEGQINRQYVDRGDAGRQQQPQFLNRKGEGQGGTDPVNQGAQVGDPLIQAQQQKKAQIKQEVEDVSEADKVITIDADFAMVDDKPFVNALKKNNITIKKIGRFNAGADAYKVTGKKSSLKAFLDDINYWDEAGYDSAQDMYPELKEAQQKVTQAQQKVDQAQADLKQAQEKVVEGDDAKVQQAQEVKEAQDKVVQAQAELDEAQKQLKQCEQPKVGEPLIQQGQKCQCGKGECPACQQQKADEAEAQKQKEIKEAEEKKQQEVKQAEELKQQQMKQAQDMKQEQQKKVVEAQTKIAQAKQNIVKQAQMVEAQIKQCGADIKQKQDQLKQAQEKFEKASEQDMTTASEAQVNDFRQSVKDLKEAQKAVCQAQKMVQCKQAQKSKLNEMLYEAEVAQQQACQAQEKANEAVTISEGMEVQQVIDGLAQWGRAELGQVADVAQGIEDNVTRFIQSEPMIQQVMQADEDLDTVLADAEIVQSKLQQAAVVEAEQPIIKQCVKQSVEQCERAVQSLAALKQQVKTMQAQGVTEAELKQAQTAVAEQQKVVQAIKQQAKVVQCMVKQDQLIKEAQQVKEQQDAKIKQALDKVTEAETQIKQKLQQAADDAKVMQDQLKQAQDQVKQEQTKVVEAEQKAVTQAEQLKQAQDALKQAQDQVKQEQLKQQQMVKEAEESKIAQQLEDLKQENQDLKQQLKDLKK